VNGRALVAAALVGGLAVLGIYTVSRVSAPPAPLDPGPPDAAACERLLVALAGGVLTNDDKTLRRHVHPDLLERLPKDRPLSAQLREVLPDAPVLLRFGEARFTADAPASLPGPASQGRVRVAVHADLGQGARFEGTLLLGVDEAQWKLLGMAQ
jgi:hypothetical protein